MNLKVEFKVVKNPKSDPYIVRKGRTTTLIYEVTQEEMDAQIDNLFNEEEEK